MLRWLGQEVGREFDGGRGFLWLPVGLGGGIALYFALPEEPSLVAVVPPFVALAALAVWTHDRPVAFRAAVLAACAALGLMVATVRTIAAHTPTLTRELTLDLTGWIASVEDAPTRGRRIYLRIADVERWGGAGAPPATIRVTMNGDAALRVGDPVRVTARLIPPSGPVVPGGYDFARAAYYGSYDAVGFTYGPPEPAPGLGEAPAAIRLLAPLADLRDDIRARIEAALPGDRGEVAAALVTGDRGGISPETAEAMRASGLGHVLAISGLHMALVAGTAFWVLRAVLALFPVLALTRPIRKWAAGGALAVAAAYLAISGASIATQRAFIMLAIMLVAILLDRRAITLRNVALAALAILLMAPEALLTASFQMSFAATAALVAAYEGWRGFSEHRARAGVPLQRPNRVLLFVAGLAFTSLVAGLATMPFALFHFQRVAPMSLVANIAAMPAVTLVVMPSALFSVVVMPLGLEAWPLAVMGLGLDWVTGVATWASDVSGDAGLLPHARPPSLPVLAAGFVWLVVWGGRLRLAGLVPLAAAGAMALTTPQPFLVVDGNASVVAVRGPDGRYHLLRLARESFVAGAFLRSDGDGRWAGDPSLAEGVRCDGLGCTFGLDDPPLVAFATSPMALMDDCLAADIVVSRYPAPAGCTAPAMIIDRDDLDTYGAHALYREEGAGYRTETAYEAARRPFDAPAR